MNNSETGGAGENLKYSYDVQFKWWLKPILVVVKVWLRIGLPISLDWISKVTAKGTIIKIDSVRREDENS